MPNYPFTIKYSLLSLILLLPHRKILIDSGSFVRRAPRVNTRHTYGTCSWKSIFTAHFTVSHVNSDVKMRTFSTITQKTQSFAKANIYRKISQIPANKI